MNLSYVLRELFHHYIKVTINQKNGPIFLIAFVDIRALVSMLCNKFFLRSYWNPTIANFQASFIKSFSSTYYTKPI